GSSGLRVGIGGHGGHGWPCKGRDHHELLQGSVQGRGGLHRWR
ncbi:MAG: hypothetical protein AVDCRST_MAG15-1933, partial [uncultured Rubellimicrobium sp.]